jgi:dipeptidyl aminopeptidase/acylaminoacyl peptidase
LLALLPLLTTPALIAGEAPPKGFSAEDLVMMNRLADPRVSPDGLQVAFTLRTTDLPANRGNQDIHLLDLATPGATPRRLTHDTAADTSPRWSRDGRHLYFLSTRSGSSQVWRLDLAGGEATQVTNYPVGVNTLLVSAAQDRIVISMDVVPECADLACSADRLATRARNKASGLVYDQLLVRHWDRWEDGSVAHLFSARIDASGKAGTPVDLMAGMRANAPSRPHGGDEEYTISPDGQHVVFAARLADRVEAWSTNFDLWQVSIDGGKAMNLTAANPAWDTHPRFLADGSLAWLAMSRPGFEADRFRVMLRDGGTDSGTRNSAAIGRATRELAAGWTLSPGALGVSRDGRSLLVSADERGQVALFRIDPTRTALPERLHAGGQIIAFEEAANGIVLALASLDAPPDLFRLPGLQRLTAVNAERLAATAPTQFEQFSFKGAANATVFGHVVKPADFAPGRKYPVAFVIHGGPQVAFGNAWSYRWNPKTLSGAGFAVVFIDFHGTPGYGQAFTDAISNDWGGKPLIDLQRGLAAAISRYDFLDGDRVCALGASYGGFMINWIAGNWPDRFRCLVNHDGIFDTRTMYYSTEELWFSEWENAGTYFDVPRNHEKFNPSAHVKQWRTPMLVIHGAQDFRVPDTQGIATFTALQRRGIESRLLFFPDENHWVLKPANSLQWHREVIGWLDAHLRAAPPDAAAPASR